MNKEEILSKLYNKNTVIYCKSEDEKYNFLNFIINNTSLKWQSDYTAENITLCNCRFLNDYFYLNCGKFLIARSSFYFRDNYDIINFNDLFNKKALNNKKPKRKIIILE